MCPLLSSLPPSTPLNPPSLLLLPPLMWCCLSLSLSLSVRPLDNRRSRLTLSAIGGGGGEEESGGGGESGRERRELLNQWTIKEGKKTRRKEKKKRKVSFSSSTLLLHGCSCCCCCCCSCCCRFRGGDLCFPNYVLTFISGGGDGDGDGGGSLSFPLRAKRGASPPLSSFHPPFALSAFSHRSAWGEGGGGFWGGGAESCKAGWRDV